ncbi:MAG: hypothetical protein E7497_08555 [Ruminococcus sp.]|nr:hypothetical protein [Ruminococcus sp.]
MKNRKRGTIFLLSLSLSISALLLLIILITDRYDEIWFAVIPFSLFPICMLINVLQEIFAEKKADRKATEKASISQSAVRQLLLENYEENIFSEINTTTMADNLKSICRKKYATKWLIMSLLPLLFLPLAIFGFRIEKSILSVIILVFLIISAFCCMAMSIYNFSGLNINVFIKKAGENLNMIERSYMGGKIVQTKAQTFNIGIDYCVYTDLFDIDFFKNSDVTEAVLTESRTKKYDRFGFYAGEKNEMYVSISIKGNKSTFKIQGSQLQLEYICDELLRCGIKINKKYIKEK